MLFIININLLFKVILFLYLRIVLIFKFLLFFIDEIFFFFNIVLIIFDKNLLVILFENLDRCKIIFFKEKDNIN